MGFCFFFKQDQSHKYIKKKMIYFDFMKFKNTCEAKTSYNGHLTCILAGQQILNAIEMLGELSFLLILPS